VPIGAEDGRGRDRYRRKRQETVACRNRQRQRERRGFALRHRFTGDGPNEGRQDGKRRGRRSAQTGDQTESRCQSCRSEPSPTIHRGHQPVGGERTFGETGNKAGGNDHQSRRINRLRKGRGA
jgi:hypothetical protein